MSIVPHLVNCAGLAAVVIDERILAGMKCSSARRGDWFFVGHDTSSVARIGTQQVLESCCVFRRRTGANSQIVGWCRGWRTHIFWRVGIGLLAHRRFALAGKVFLTHRMQRLSKSIVKRAVVEEE